MNDVELAWAAGLFEGEGCITIARGRYPRLVVRMNDEDVIRKLHRIVGVGSVVCDDSPSMPKPQWRWGCYRAAHVRELLEQMLPHLGERRRDKANEALELL